MKICIFAFSGKFINSGNAEFLAKLELGAPWGKGGGSAPPPQKYLP